jgi:cytochrome c nitrite reductase small subunit
MGMYRLAIVAAALIGAALGVGGYTFVYSRGASYLTNDPAACANCHVMSEHYAAWIKGSHRSVAVCNDCHTPKNIVLKYRPRARTARHSLGFTTALPGPAQITRRLRDHGACVPEVPHRDHPAIDLSAGR